MGHTSGWPLVLCLVIKETPYLVLMIAGALHQVSARGHVAIARSLGYGSIEAWMKLVLPQIYPQIRLPIFAVLAFSLSVVDVALILGPANPPPLAVLAFRWFTESDIGYFFPGSAAAVLQFVVVALAIVIWRANECGASTIARRWIVRGVRRGAATIAVRIGFVFAIAMLLAAAFAIAGMALWSIADQWRFPSALPTTWTLANWSRELKSLAEPIAATLALALASTFTAIVLVLGCLENEARVRRTAGVRALWLLYLPLLVPQIAFLFGAQVLLVKARIDGTFFALVWAHLIFVLPYVFLSLADPWRSLDPRYARAAASLGASPARTFFRIRMPLLFAPLMIACAIGFAVSVAQYLPTVFAGSGRIATLTTDAVTLASGADRRVVGAYALLQALLPLIVYVIAATGPARRFGRR